MEARKLAFPIALAIVWVLMAALAMVDFASFTATAVVAPARRTERPLVLPRPGQG